MAKIRDIREQNPEFVVDLIKLLSESDPTKTNKYLPFMVDKTKEWLDWFLTELKNETFKEMFTLIKDFEELSNRNLLDNKDIYSYESNQDIIDAISEAKDKVTKSEVKKKETITLHEDDRWLVLQPLTSRSSNVYGKSTKWCVASNDNNFKKYYKDYTNNGVLVFLIDKSVKERETKDKVYSKVAFHKYCDKPDSLTIWDSKDKKLGVSEAMEVYSMIPTEVLSIINGTMNGKSNAELANERGCRADD